jgi:hypothetical protein
MAKDSGYPAVSGGNEQVDFVWGNFAMQPNEDRTDGTSTVVVAADAADNYDWSGYTVYPSGRLDAAADSHAIALANYAGYPGFTASQANYIVTAASGNGTTVTYTSQNNLVPGQTVTITGMTTSAFNLSSVTVATATAVGFTVTNAATGTAVTGARGRVETISTTDDGAYSGGTAYITVPSVSGLTTAAATDDLKDAGFGTVTVATAASNVGKTVTAVSRTAGSAVMTITAGSHGFVAGNKVTISDVSGGATVNGVWSVLAVTNSNVFTVTGTATTVLALTGLAGVVSGVAGTIKTQSTAAAAASISAGATITITPFAAAS